MRIRLFLALTTALVTAAGPFARAQEADNAPAPPSRVGQIAQVQGGVSFNGGGTDGWTAASLNYPVSTGDSLYTQPDASTTMTVDSSRIALAGGTELQITQLDDSTLAATESQGEAWLDLRYLQPGQQFIIATPRGNVTITRAGRYDLIAGDANTPTQVTVLYGAASIANSDEQLNIAAGQTATLSGSAPVSASVGGAIRDGFIDQQIAAAEPAPPSYAPPAVQQMTGAYELSNYGQWSQTPQYGAVWYPQVAPGWVPYREGHWAYVAPWGWTWVEAEPWGFAPFHYGRWIDEDGRWGWAPAPIAEGYAEYPHYQPVYAPALVSFFGVGGGGLSVGIAITAGALAAGSIGWVPLAPREAYYPTYHCPPRYIQQINVANVRNVTNITEINRTVINNNHTTIVNNYGPRPDQFANRRAATFVPAGAMTRGESIARIGHAAPPNLLAAAQPIRPAVFQVARPGPQAPGRPAAIEPRLPPAPTPLGRAAPAPAPKPALFAQQRGLPMIARPGIPARPALTSHVQQAPAFNRPAPMPAANRAPLPQQPFIHTPPAPPHMPNVITPQPQRPQVRPEAPQAIRPPAAPQFHPPAQPQYHPPVQQYHPPAQPAYHPPVQEFHPPAQPQFHPPAEPAYHPPVQEFHPPAQPQFHPPAQPAFHPPAPRPAPPPPRDDHKPPA